MNKILFLLKFYISKLKNSVQQEEVKVAEVPTPKAVEVAAPAPAEKKEKLKKSLEAPTTAPKSKKQKSKK